jgi:hypothetical protein
MLMAYAMQKTILLSVAAVSLAAGSCWLGWWLRGAENARLSSSEQRGPAVGTSHAKTSVSNLKDGAQEGKSPTDTLQTNSNPEQLLRSLLQSLLDDPSSAEDLDPTSPEFWKYYQAGSQLSSAQALAMLDWWFQQLEAASEEKRDEISASDFEGSLLPLLAMAAINGDPWQLEEQLGKDELIDKLSLDVAHVYHAKAAKDPERFKAEIFAMKDREEQHLASTALLKTVAKQDPDAALDLILGPYKDVFDREYGENLPGLNKLMRTKPAEVMDKLLKGSELDSFSRTLLDTWSERDPGSLKTWLTQQSMEVQLAGYNTLLEGGQVTLQETLQQMPKWQNLPKDELSTLGDHLGILLAGQPGDYQTNWQQIQSLPANAQPSAQIGFIEGLMDKEMMHATELMTRLPDGDVKNSVISTLVRSHNLPEEDPHAALQWALASTDKVDRQELVKEVAEEWIDNDPAAAVPELEKLPGDLRDLVLKK